MNWYVFFNTFYFVFFILISVGPGFLTIANIAMTHFYKTSAIAVLGCFLGDCILISLGALFAKKAIQTIPPILTAFLGFCAVFFLLYLAYKFYKTNIQQIKLHTLSKVTTINDLSFTFALFCLKMSSPISILGYTIIFTNANGIQGSAISAILGGCFASFFVNFLMVVVFGTIGKKIGVKILSTLNKITASFISLLAITFFIKIIKSLILKEL